MWFGRFSRREQPTRQPRGAEPVPVVPERAVPDRSVPEPAVALADEAEAFLRGHLVVYLVANDRPVPAWAVLNEIAHGTGAELAALAESGAEDGGPDDGAPRWRAAQRSLAAKLLAGAPTPDEVAEVQRAVLVPLELWLIDRSRVATVTSRRVVDMASDVLDDLRAGH